MPRVRQHHADEHIGEVEQITENVIAIAGKRNAHPQADPAKQKTKEDERQRNQRRPVEPAHGSAQNRQVQTVALLGEFGIEPQAMRRQP